MIYFLQGTDTNAIKIGWTDGPIKQRITAILTASSEDLKVLGVMEGDRSTEQALHTRFEDCHKAREWFHASDGLLQFIAENAEPVHIVLPSRKRKPSDPRTGHKGDGWKRLSINMNPHIASIEQSIMTLRPGTRSAIVGQAVKAFRESLIDRQEQHSQFTEHWRAYASEVVAKAVGGTTIHLTDDAEADLQALGERFEEIGWKQLLRVKNGYNRKMLIYFALRWYADHLTKESETNQVE